MKKFLCTVLIAFAGSAAGAATDRTLIPILDAPTVTAACRQAVLEARESAGRLAATPEGQVSVETFLDPWDRAGIALEEIVGPAAILANVHPEAKTRDAAQDCLIQVSSLQNEIFQNEDLYRRALALKTATPVQEKYRRDLLDGFEDSGVSLPGGKRARAKEIADRIALLGEEFGKNVRDNTTKLTFPLDEAKGLPEAYVERLKDGKGNIVVGFDYPDYVPFMSSAENEKARERYMVAYNRRGTPRNLEILDEIVALRKELATLYGYSSFAEYVTRRRMVENAATVTRFLADVAKTVRDVEKRDVEELRKLKASTLGTPLADTKLNRWDLTFWRERLREQRYAFDQESTRKYFPTEAAQAWLLDVTGRIYGVKFERAAVPLWHPDAQYFDVKDAKSGELVGGVYLDLFPRDGKYKHAAAWPVRGVSRKFGRKPISVLVTNFDRKGLTVDEVETFFHEFGHVVHGVLSETEYNAHAGTSTQRDFVEAPSQIFEEWVRDPEALKLLAAHCPECPRIDAATLRRLKDSRNFGRGIDYSRQQQYAAFDMELAGSAPGKALDVWKRIEEASPLGYVPGTEFPGTFGHIAGSYAAGYYGYMWAEVIALDMVSKWDGSLMDPAVGGRFRRTILARGGEEPAKAIVEQFLGRPVNNQAFFRDIVGEPRKGDGGSVAAH